MSVDWDQLYRATYQDLVRFLHRMVWDADLAQDLAQETFVRALKNNPEKPRSWLFAVAANLARDEARTAIRRKRHLVLIKTEARVAQEAVRESPDSAEQAERSTRVRSALERLSDRDREVLLLWDADLSYDEIAEQIGLSRGAIGTTLARARRRLVAEYEELEAKNVARG